ncbi:MAG TPA: ATP-binding protein [Ignavibacteriales bacterium]|nr:ATP-binding protein [Ignavibacteriales bacterium]
MRSLPIGIQTFEKIRTGNYFYVDKTKEAYELITQYEYVFLSRPRRFGKSLFLDTLKCIFQGRKELFEGLYIYDKWNWEEKHPVIYICWDGVLDSMDGIKEKLNIILLNNQERLDVKCEEGFTPSGCFERLIKKTYDKYQKQVVILVDEYDKPILDNITNNELSRQAREYLRGVYSIIKGNSQYIRFVFLTGVSKFSKTGIFSGLNQLVDITLDEKYGNICGYRQEDVEELLNEYNANVDLEEVKKWYNGYYWLKDKLYNPFDILLFISKNYKFSNYWFKSGTPTFLVELVEKKPYYLPDLENIRVDELLLERYDVDKIIFPVLLFQAGYLTIEREELIGNKITYKLRIPNLEVGSSLMDALLDLYQKDVTEKSKLQNETILALERGDLETFRKQLEVLFSSIPYENYTNNKMNEYEGFYAAVVYTFIYSLAFPVIAEDTTNKGRIDLTVVLDDKIYIFEFKVKGENPLEQIKERKYYEKYLNQGKEIYLVGIKFDHENRNIKDIVWEKIS